MSRNENKGQTLANLFNGKERKELFIKYIIFLGWLEVLIFIGCWFYQLGTDGYDRFGPVEVPFPWKIYFLIAFLAPVATTFLIGMVIVGFNKYLGEPVEEHSPPGNHSPSSSKTERLKMTIDWLQKLPYLGLLVILSAGIAIVYNLDKIIRLLQAVGEKAFKMVFILGGALLGVVSILSFVLLLLNYKLRKREMEYNYRTQVAERLGLVILDDNTVLNEEGRLLVRGRKWKSSVPLLTESKDSPARERNLTSSGLS